MFNGPSLEVAAAVPTCCVVAVDRGEKEGIFPTLIPPPHTEEERPLGQGGREGGAGSCIPKTKKPKKLFCNAGKWGMSVPTEIKGDQPATTGQWFLLWSDGIFSFGSSFSPFFRTR